MQKPCRFLHTLTIVYDPLIRKKASFLIQIVSVIVPVPHQSSLSYAVPDCMMVQAGSIVRVPLGQREVVGIVTETSPADTTKKISHHKLRSIIKLFDCPPISDELLRFIHFVADYTLTPPGQVARMVLRSPVALDPEKPSQGLRWSGCLPDKVTPARARVFEVAKTSPSWMRAELSRIAGVSPQVIDTLFAQGFFEPVDLPPPLLVKPPDPDLPPPDFNEEQALARAHLQHVMRQHKFTTILLDGITGSGKTEVYFEALAATIKQGRQALILLPEIALTQQFLNRFSRRFGSAPAQWHSDISPRAREKLWRQVIEGRIQVVAGARSALFLPFADLGVIIVDEEHDASYKQEEKVIYHARDMAVARGSLANIPVILASATPSIESQVNVARGRYQSLHLKSRYGMAQLPQITTIDMRKNPPRQGMFLSPPLLEEIDKTLARNEQSLLFLNRRGFAPLTLCRVCGHRFGCPNCSSWLVEHKFREQLLCHHCGYHMPTPQACPSCGALDHLAACGPGVERIADEVRIHFPQARLLILSADLTSSLGQMRRELAAIVEGEVDIVIGTQLVAKGHHFPHMTFVGVVDGDMGLMGGDPRGAERAFQLLSQVTGRAGREHQSATGAIQTYQPDHPVMQALVAGDREGFYLQEIAHRRRDQMPPFGRLGALIVSDITRAGAEAHARALRAAAPASDHIEIFGPAEAPLALLRGRHRFRLLVHGTRESDLQSYIRALLAAAPKTRGAVKVTIDIDPQSFL